mmetsp:Transcript_33482/g.98663  ORF Transcript_33482/g.98663 Transcript_33482/m.98663 type:complete len:150 (+) Transcript_33482:539-988(+)
MFALELETRGRHVSQKSVSSMRPQFAVYPANDQDVSIPLHPFGLPLPLPDYGLSKTYYIALPTGFGAVDDTKLKLEAVGRDGWLIGGIKIQGTSMNLAAPCEGNCDQSKPSIWLDSQAYDPSPYDGGYAKSDVWYLSSKRVPVVTNKES